MGIVFESKPAQSTHLSLEAISWVCLILSIRNYACHLFLRRSYTSAVCCQTLKFSREKSPQLDKYFFLGSFCLGLLMFLLLLVPTAIFFCSLSKQWLNPRLQSKVSPQQPQRDPAEAAGPCLRQGFQQAPCTGMDGKDAGTEPSSTSHPLSGINVLLQQTHPRASLLCGHWTSNALHTASPPLYGPHLLHCFLQIPAWSILQQRSPSHAHAVFPAHPPRRGVWDVKGGGSEAASSTADEGRNTFVSWTFFRDGQRMLLVAWRRAAQQGRCRDRSTQRNVNLPAGRGKTCYWGDNYYLCMKRSVWSL